MIIPFFYSKENIPKFLGEIPFKDIHIYEDPRFGVSLSYGVTFDKNLSKIFKADIYLYNLGLDNIPFEVNCDSFEEIVRTDYENILIATKGLKDLKFDMFGCTSSSKSIMNRDFWFGSYSFCDSLSGCPGVTFESSYILTKIDNYFVKFRITSSLDANKSIKVISFFLEILENTKIK